MRVSTDNPIRTPEDDVLGRSKAARAFAEQVLSQDAREGIVVGVLGPWGSGKTSFVNLARAHLEDAGSVVVDFNPWMFSGAEQLVDSFFIELSAQLKLRPELAELGKNLEEYGGAFAGLSWIPFLGPWIERGRSATDGLAKLLQRKQGGVGERRAKIENSLRSLEVPLVVVIDDIDRLTTSEIRDIFRLVRLTASFPNVVYVVAFDRIRVEAALDEQNIPGRSYLEKILQMAIDLPQAPARVLTTQSLKDLECALADIEKRGPFDEVAWQDVFPEVIRPLLRNMRDVRRYIIAVQGTVRELEGQVALVDVLALEAVRVFLPDVFNHLHRLVDGLTAVAASGPARVDSSYLKPQVDKLIEVAGDRDAIVRALIHRVFPAGDRHIGGGSYGPGSKSTWLKNRRVAHEDWLRLYLERVVGDSLHAFTGAEQAWGRMADRESFDRVLRALEVERLQDVIASLEAYEDQFAPAHVEPGCVVLLNLLPDLPERQRGMYQLDTRMIVSRVVYRLMRSLKDPDKIEAAARRILPEVSTLSSKLELIIGLGHREGAGHKLVSKEAGERFEMEWKNEVRSASESRLAAERDALRVLRFARQHQTSFEPPLVITDSPRLTLAILRSARHEAIGQSMGSRAVHRSARLAWDSLIELFGSEDELKNRIARLKENAPANAEELLDLAGKYAQGWRPDEREMR